MKNFNLVAVILASVGVCLCQDYPSVVTNLGTIIGHYKTSFHRYRYAAYEGVPYALPPIGNRRFQPPEPIKAWEKPLSAVSLEKKCLEHKRRPNEFGSYVEGVEDCLYLHIYVPTKPNTPKDSPYPVIFYIHGGSFQMGSIDHDEEKYLIDHDVVYVHANYRLGVLGFLSTEDDVVAGNMGLKDQSLALRWVKENIAAFGGDPERITLIGHSAGAASVHYHYLSPMSAGLFHAGISHSGTALDYLAQAKNSRGKALELGEILGCPTESVRSMVQCLKKVPARSLVEAQIKFSPILMLPARPFGPVVEKVSEGSFIDRPPIEILTNGDVYDVPWVTGVVSEDGLYPTAEFVTPDEKILRRIDEDWEMIATLLHDYNYTIARENHAEVARKIRRHYLGDEPINRANLHRLIKMVGDRTYYVDGAKAARAQAEANETPVWFYYYSYRATDSRTKESTHTDENLGVAHGDDVYLVIGNDVIDPTKSKDDMKMHHILANLWVSVAKHGEPNVSPSWTKMDPSKKLGMNYLHIAMPESLEMKFSDDFGQRSFWDSLGFDENKIDGEFVDV
ncbi:hypothetical protein TKK_0019453 [Trichogramma kaykai]|uniref:Carboxylic ester hydrolase n=1 Tax=Trichogramma kaykai TaxID=54128 RepID=A0ABD2VT83_9HYME